MILLMLIILLSIISINLSIYRITKSPQTQPTYKCTNSGCVKKNPGEEGYSPNDYKDTTKCEYDCKADCDETGCVITQGGPYSNVEACNVSEECNADCVHGKGCVITQGGQYNSIDSCNANTGNCEPHWYCTYDGCSGPIYPGQQGYDKSKGYTDENTCITNCKADCDTTYGGCAITPGGTYSNVTACNATNNCNVSCVKGTGCVITQGGQYNSIDSCNANTGNCEPRWKCDNGCIQIYWDDPAYRSVSFEDQSTCEKYCSPH